MHVDTFIDSYKTDPYASFFLALHRFGAVLQLKFEEFIKPYRLFCTYNGKRYRVTGASRLGDIWLREDFSMDTGYDSGCRVAVSDCSEWGPTP